MQRYLSVILLALVGPGSQAFSQACTGLCLQQTTCPGSATTSISGTVFAPNGSDPLPNVLVYVPNASVPAFTAGVACEVAGTPASGSPLVSTTTAVDGTFTLTNMPVGPDIPLVIQAGRWRTQVTIANVASCVNTVVPSGLTRLPSSHSATKDIPHIAIVTGSVDAAECVLRKIGIADSEFRNPGGAGHINLYLGTIGGAGSAGAQINGTTPTEDQLWSTQAALNQYDLVMLPCQGTAGTPTAAAQQNMVNFTNAGGRIFATHFSYDWLASPFSGTALWDLNQTALFQNDPEAAVVNQTFPKGQQLAEWLQLFAGTTTPGQIPVGALRNDQNGVVAPTQSWLTITDNHYTNAVMQFTFNTPTNAPTQNQCGRVLFNEYHVENTESSPTTGLTFPSECAGGPLTPQEKLLEFSLFDLSTFVTPDQPPTVTVGVTNSPSAFVQGDSADGITINVTDTSTSIAANPSLTLTAVLPTGLSAVSMAGANVGTGWTCTVGTLTCTRGSALVALASDPIALTVGVASNATVGSGALTVSATASGGALTAGVTGQDSVTVKGIPAISWSTPAAILYGTALSSSQLDATANVAGSFVYTPSIGTVLGAGSQTLSVTFTPTDTTDYGATSTTMALTVNKASLTVTANAASMNYGGALPTFSAGVTGFVNSDPSTVVSGTPSFSNNATLTNGAPNAGSWALTPATGSLSASNYMFTTFAASTLTVGKAALTVNGGREEHHLPRCCSSLYGIDSRFGERRCVLCSHRRAEL